MPAPKVKTKAKPLGVVKPPVKDLEINQLKLVGEKNKVLLNRVITDISLEQTIEGASTLTVVISDESRAFIRSQLVREKSTIVLDNVAYRLVKVSRAGATVTLIFEETGVNILREINTPRKANRDNTSRAQFIRGMVEEPKEFRITFKCPELNEKQQTAKPAA